MGHEDHLPEFFDVDDELRARLTAVVYLVWDAKSILSRVDALMPWRSDLDLIEDPEEREREYAIERRAQELRVADSADLLF